MTDWSQQADWQVQPSEKIFTEALIGKYTASDLLIVTPDGERLMVEVKGRGPLKASGRVQLSAWPTLFRVILLRKTDADGWVIRTDSDIPIRRPWNKEAFISVANDLMNVEQ